MSVATRYSKSLWSYNPIPRGCILYLPFFAMRLGATIKSIDPDGRTLTVTGATSGIDGAFFDGTNDSISHPTFLDVIPASDELTFWAWIKPTGGTGTARTIINKRNIGTEDRISFEVRADEKVRFATEGGDAGFKNVDSAALNPSTGTFFYIAGVYKAGVANRVYVNTAEVSGDTADTVLDGTAEDFTIGEHGTGSQDYTGYIRELGVLDRAITKAESDYIYYKTLSGR